jgi:hypothetical protein
MFMMKQNRWLLGLLLGILVLVALLSWLEPDRLELQPTSKFLGFTNGPGTDALFLVSHYPRHETEMPRITAVFWNDNGDWKEWTMVAGKRTAMSVRYSTETEPDVVMAIPVWTTNQPIRFVLLFPEQTLGVREIIQQMFKRFVSRGGPKPPGLRQGRAKSLYFTNETAVLGAR